MNTTILAAAAHACRSKFSVFLRVGLVCAIGSGVAGCTAMTGSLFPSFGFTGTTSSDPDCGEIELRMKTARAGYASVLGKERPAVYLSFAGNLSKAMKAKRLKGVHEMSELQLDDVVVETRASCLKQQLPGNVCAGAERLGEAYRPMLAAAHDAFANYCGDRPIR